MKFSSEVPEKRVEKLRRRPTVQMESTRTYLMQRGWISRLLTDSKLVATDQRLASVVDM